MRKLAFFTAAALCFGLAPFAPRLGPVGGSLALVALCVAFSLAASGAFAALAVAGGALGAFASGMLSGASPAVAGAALAALCFGERSLRVRGNARVLHLGAALVGGALAGTLTTSFALSSMPVRAVAVTVAAVLLSLPLLVAADDPLAHALDGAAEDLASDKAAAALLREAAELRRAMDEALLDRRTTLKVRATWAALLRLSEARVRLSRSPARTGAQGDSPSPAEIVRQRLDERIGDHVKALSRAVAAAGAASAAEVSLDDSALRGIEAAGDSLEEVSRAIVDQT
jgi:MFS family permease